MLILDCEAEKIGKNKLNIIFNISRDYVTQEKKYFLLPDERSKFIKLTDDIYSRNEEIIPSTFNPGANASGDGLGETGKAAFVKKFIEYTLKQNYSYVQIGYLNDYYDSIFSPKGEEDLKKIDSLAEKAKDDTEDILVKLQALKEEREKLYKEKQERIDKLRSQATPPTELEVIVDPDDRPKSNSERPVQDKQLSESEKAQREASPPDVANKLDGINGDMLVEAVPVPMTFPGDGLVRGQNNAGLHMTRDEEYRFKGHTSAGACYLYAGRRGSKGPIQMEEKDGQLGPKTNTILRTPNNLRRDAAYVYLSQKADSRSLLGVAAGSYGKKAGRRKGQSLAAIKADDVVLMARESGIRLITGTDSRNSKGGPLFSQFGIELIAGNDDTDLQPLVMGSNLRKYLRGLSKTVDNLSSVVYDFISSQTSFNASVTNHTHYDPFCILLGSMTGNPLGVLGGKNLPSPETLQDGTKTLLESLMQMQGTINQVFSQINNDFNGLEQPGAYYINSELNKTN
jgi:hypothetical protein